MSLRLCFALLLAGLGAAAARGQVTFTFAGTALYPSMGYTEGQSVTFSVTTSSTFPNNDSSYFVESTNNWIEDYYDESPLFVGLTGTGLTGSFTRPGNLSESGLGDPYAALITASDQKWLYVALGNDGRGGIGLTLPSAAMLNELFVAIDITAGPFTALPCYNDPVAYFSALTGTYEGICSGTLSLRDNLYEYPDSDHIHSVDFNITSMTISAVPEPSTYAALLGVAVLGIVAMSRCRQKRLKS